MKTDNYPIPSSVNAYGDLPEECKSEVDELLADYSIQEIRAIGDYCMACASKMSRELEQETTMDDFKKKMKDSSDEIPTESNNADDTGDE